MNKTFITLLLFFSVFGSYLTAAPATIQYQGLLSDSSGIALANHSHTILINLYATEQDEAILYTQSFVDVLSDENGMYSIEIGDADLVSVLEGNESLWLELTVNGEALSPRQAIHSVPYALHAESANRLVNAADSNISGSLSVSGTSNFNDINVDGSVEGRDGRFDILDVEMLEIDSPFGRTRFDGFINKIGGDVLMIETSRTDVFGDLTVFGRVNFENAQEVRVPTPDQDNEATNKGYVDNVVVPSGGLIAWPASNAIPTGWSNPGLTAPMTDYIWIQKN